MDEEPEYRQESTLGVAPAVELMAGLIDMGNVVAELGLEKISGVGSGDPDQALEREID